MGIKVICLVCSVLAVATIVGGATLREPFTYTVGEKVNDVFTYIGSNEDKRSIYFKTSTRLSWSAAEAMCISVLGNNASLLSLETLAEHDYISKFLDDARNTETSFWTAGKYVGPPRDFVWAMGQQINETLWGEGQPSQKFESSKVSMVLGELGSWTYSSSNESETHPFICEYIGGSAKEPVPCFITNDLVISLDSSGSISPTEFEEAKGKYVAELADKWNMWNETKLSMMVYSDDVRVVFDLSKKLGDFEMGRMITGAPHLRSGTASHLALDKGRADLVRFNRFEVRNLVFLTDGYSNNPSLTLTAAKRINEEGINVYVVGIGSNVNQKELLTIAGNDENRVFTADNFAELQNLLKPMSILMCKGFKNNQIP